MPHKEPPEKREILYEIATHGSIFKVVAVDSLTGTEVTVQGPVSAGPEALKQVAKQKLKYVLNKKTEKS